MKKKHFEKTAGIIFALVTMITLEIIIILFLYNYKIFNYTTINSIYLDTNNIMVFVNKKDRKILYKNSYLYIDNKKIKYKISKDKGITLKENNNDYYELYIKLKLRGKYKLNDYVKITIQNEKIRLLEIFKLIWDGDVNS